RRPPVTPPTCQSIRSSAPTPASSRATRNMRATFSPDTPAGHPGSSAGRPASPWAPIRGQGGLAGGGVPGPGSGGVGGGGSAGLDPAGPGAGGGPAGPGSAGPGAGEGLAGPGAAGPGGGPGESAALGVIGGWGGSATVAPAGPVGVYGSLAWGAGRREERSVGTHARDGAVKVGVTALV